mgnify:CR=1 FL=1
MAHLQNALSCQFFQRVKSSRMQFAKYLKLLDPMVQHQWVQCVLQRSRSSMLVLPRSPLTCAQPVTPGFISMR